VLLEQRDVVLVQVVMEAKVSRLIVVANVAYLAIVKGHVLKAEQMFKCHNLLEMVHVLLTWYCYVNLMCNSFIPFGDCSNRICYLTNLTLLLLLF